MAISLAGVVGVTTVAFFTHEIIGDAALRAFSNSVAPIGWWLTIGAAGVLVVDFAALIAYAARHGQTDDSGDEALAGNPAVSPSLSNIPLTRLSKVKMLGKRSVFISDESLVDGTATFGERLFVLGIVAAFISFLLIFVGFALQMTFVPILAVVFPVIPGLWVFVRLREIWHDYQSARKKVLGREPAR